jgi:hypothetical protein
VKVASVKVLPLLDVSSKWKLLVRSHRLRRRTAVRVMMTLVKWKVIQRKKWSNLVINSLCNLKSLSTEITDEMSLKQIWDVTDTSSELWTFECLGEKRNQAAVRNWLTVMFVKLLYSRCTVMTLVREKNSLVSDEDNDENRNCCWLNIRDCMFAVACCYNTRSYSSIELGIM